MSNYFELQLDSSQGLYIPLLQLQIRLRKKREFILTHVPGTFFSYVFSQALVQLGYANNGRKLQTYGNK